jgi:ABC-type sugar transport system ATPase subunit
MSASCTGPSRPSGALLGRGISHRFNGTRALHAVDLEVRGGEIHALVGENGAGKSTLVKVLSGALRPTDGRVELDGVPLRLRGPMQARRHGIAVVHQDYHLFPELSVAENIVGVSGRAPTLGPLLRRGGVRALAAEALRRIGVELDPDRPARSLDPAERKLVEIARALMGDVRFLILDEPTAALESRQTERLLTLMRRLRESGKGLLFVTHRLDEVMKVADRATVLRNGEWMGVLTSGVDMTIDQLIVRILGKRPRATGRAPARGDRRTMLRIDEMRLGPGKRPVALEVRGGEILGLVGLAASGATVVLRRLGGVTGEPGARIELDGRPISTGSIRDALRSGIAYVPEDRQAQGVFPELSVAVNIGIASIDRLSIAGWTRQVALNQLATRYRDALGIHCRSLDQPVKTLSGGNQQKVLIARWLSAGARILVVEEPTHGVDIGARVEIRQHLREFASGGGAVVFFSSDPEEVQTLADRIAIFRHGELIELVDNRGGARPTSEHLTARMAGLPVGGCARR